MREQKAPSKGYGRRHITRNTILSISIHGTEGRNRASFLRKHVLPKINRGEVKVVSLKMLQRQRGSLHDEDMDRARATLVHRNDIDFLQKMFGEKRIEGLIDRGKLHVLGGPRMTKIAPGGKLKKGGDFFVNEYLIKIKRILGSGP